MNTPDFFKKLNENYPFITVCSYAQQDYVGIIQNRDYMVTTMYDYGSLVLPELRTKFLELGDVWWWESNHSIPINIFLKSDWDPFRRCLRTFVNKDLEILHGPICSLSEMARKKSKRKSITLVRRIE